MAGFKTHIATSTTLGVAYGGAGWLLLRDSLGEAPLATCLLGTGLCSIAGMLPDLDSDSGIPLRETIAFTAAVVPMLLMERFSHMGMSHEMMVLVGGLVYFAIRFGLAGLLKRFTVHRGMFHSLPAALVAAELAYLLCSCHTEAPRLFKAGAVLLGFMSHLILDELYSIEWKGGRWRFKKSFGTALKLWGANTYANISVYAKVAVLGFFVIQDPVWMENFEARAKEQQLPKAAIEVIDNVWR